jgi:hypothetical protein
MCPDWAGQGGAAGRAKVCSGREWLGANILKKVSGGGVAGIAEVVGEERFGATNTWDAALISVGVLARPGVLLDEPLLDKPVVAPERRARQEPNVMAFQGGPWNEMGAFAQ